MQFGRITTQPCVTDQPPVDNRCDDRAFALQNPDACPAIPTLIIKPGVSLTCILGNVGFRAFTTVNGVETDVTDDAIFNSSDPNVAVIGAQSGHATGLAAGNVTISAAYNGMTAFADFTILAGDSDCCEQNTVAAMVIVDRTNSMGQVFNSTYASKLAFAKVAATQFINEVNQTKDTVGLIQFTDESVEVLSELTANKTAVAALVPGITQTKQSTSFADVLEEAVAELAASNASRKLIVLISDGQNQDGDSLADALQTAEDFKASGGIILAFGVRAAGTGYSLLSALSTGGFFVNAHDLTATVSLEYLSGLKGYICAGNCAPTGDEYAASGQFNFCAFENWDVVEGHVDLIGNGFMDLLPGNGLYVDMAGSRSEYKGRMVSRNSYAIEADKVYTMSAYVAGNQRVDETPNSIRVKVFSLNSDGVANPTVAPSVVLTSSSGSATPEIYEYAYSYQNANGETEISDPTAISTAGAATFEITVTATVDAAASAVRFWRRSYGGGTWYLIAEASSDSPEIVDTLNTAALEAALAAGTLDRCARPAENNLTGTPIVHLSQQTAINDYTKDFQPYSFSFTAPYDADVFISIQQTDTPTGYSATGLLLDRVKFANTTDGITLLDDDFDGENVQYIPPACGIGTTPILTNQICYTLSEAGDPVVGTCEFTCADGQPCAIIVTGLTGLAESQNGVYYYASGYESWTPLGSGGFPHVHFNTTSGKWVFDNDVTQYESDTLIGTYTLVADSWPSDETSETITVSAICFLTPPMTSNTDPSGEASSSAGLEPWKLFDGDYDTEDYTALPTAWWQYQFDTAQTVRYYIIYPPDHAGSPTDWTLAGSNNGSDWTTIDTQAAVVWSGADPQSFTVASPGSYTYYRINVTTQDGSSTGSPYIRALEFYGDAPSGSPSITDVTYCLYTFGYLSGYNCYGAGCLEEPPVSQMPDPNPLPDIEAGFTPPQMFTSTKQYCAQCGDGFVNFQSELSNVALVLDAYQYTLGVGHQYTFEALEEAVILRSFRITSDLNVAYFNLQGSNNGTDWTTLRSADEIPVFFATESGYQDFTINNTLAFTIYRVIVSNWNSSDVGGPNSTSIAMTILTTLAQASTGSVCRSGTATSETSQAHADEQALEAARIAAESALNCVRRYSSTMSYTAHCTDGVGADVTRSATAYSYVSQEDADDQARDAAQALAEADLDCTGSNNGQYITINDRAGDSPAKATPYPSVQYVTSEIEAITKVTVTLIGWNHGNYADCHVLLVSPAGTAVYLAGNAMDAGFNAFDSRFVFDDDAADPLPEFSRPTGPALTVTYRPTVYGDQLSFPSPAPALPAGPNSYATTLAEFIGEDPNGAWKLYILDDTALDSGYIYQGFSLTIT